MCKLFKSCSKDGGCCKEMRQIQRHSQEAHAQIHDLQDHIDKLKKLLVSYADANKELGKTPVEAERG